MQPPSQAIIVISTQRTIRGSDTVLKVNPQLSLKTIFKARGRKYKGTFRLSYFNSFLYDASSNFFAFSEAINEGRVFN
jgi:hypothetical protein